MPAVGREKEKEQKQKQKQRKKPGRVPTSCAECRRLKLRCDRNVPCEKCVSRGCGSICPDGVLTPGKNGRMILAGTEELHDRIDHFTSRVRELESALQTLQVQVSNKPHPLLCRDLLGEGLRPSTSPSRPSVSSSADPRIAPTPEPREPTPHSASLASMDPNPASITDFSGTLSIGGTGQSSFFGPTARLEFLQFLAHRTTKPYAKPTRLSHELFEFACQEHTTEKDRLGKEILSLRPPGSEAVRLCDLYLKHGNVMYSSISRSELIDEIFMTVYRAESFSDLHHPETLALLLIIFALAVHFNPKSRADSHEANEYYLLAKACLRLSSHRENTLSYVQTLIHMAHYLHYSGAELGSPDIRSEYLGRAIQIGYKMGLHLHGIRWVLPDDLAQKRSRTFCEIFLLDTWTSFYSGRPPMVSLAFMDKTTPRDNDEGVDVNGNRKPGFHTWTYKYAILLHSIMAVAFGPNPPSYPTLLDLDLKVRNFPVPIQWRPICDQDSNTPSELHMARFLVSFAKESTLLNLHRSYFISALEESPNDLSKHSFIPSVLAIYRSSWRLMRGLRCIWDAAPESISKMNVAWSQAISAAVIMTLFITRSPGSHLTDPALQELDLLLALFEEAAPICQTASDLLVDLQSLRKHSRTIAGRPYQNEGYVISASDLDRLSGKTYLLRLPETGHTTSMRPAQNSSALNQAHTHTRPPLYPGSSIKKDPSPSRGTSTTLSDFLGNSPFSNTTPLPVPLLHSAASSATQSFHHPNIPYSYQNPHSFGSQVGHSETYSQGQVSRTHVSSSPSASHPGHSSVPPPAPPTPVISAGSHAVHPTIMQDIRDFTMRGTPGSSTMAHYFDIPPQEDINDAAMSIQVLAHHQSRESSSGAGGASRSISSAISAASVSAGPVSATSRARAHNNNNARNYTPTTTTPTPSHSHSQSPPGGSHNSNNTQDSSSDYVFFQSYETSFHLDYAPQPRSPFTAANFGVGMGGGNGTASTMHSLYQEVVEHLGFH